MGGGITQKLLDRIQALEDELQSVKDELALSGIELEALKASRATPSAYGLAKICPVDVADVTEANGMVLGAFEKNKSFKGSIANQVHNIENSISIKRNTALLFSTYATVAGGILTTTSAPAPTTGYSLDILSIDLYGERLLTKDEISKFNILIRSGGFILTSTDETIKNLAGNRILILGYSFI